MYIIAKFIYFQKINFHNVQPDLCAVCDTSKLDDKGCIGAPDLIIEIMSPGNSNSEMALKFDLHQENQVAEYWIVNQSEKLYLFMF